MEKYCQSRKRYRSEETDTLQHAVEVLQLSFLPPVVVAREEEKSYIESFLEETVGQGECGSLYINGLPGTGKTVCVHEVAKRYCNHVNVRGISFVNAMVSSTTGSLFAKVAEDLKLRKKGDRSSCMTSLQTGLVGGRSKTPGVYIVVMDEVDGLKHDRAALYQLFKWADATLYPCSRLVFISIANALDLTATADFPTIPRVLQFAAYTKTQLQDIVSARLSLLPSAVMDAKAIELTAARVAARVGDARKVLDLCREAVLSKLNSTVSQYKAASAAAAAGAAPAAAPLTTTGGEGSSAATAASVSTAVSAPVSAPRPVPTQQAQPSPAKRVLTVSIGDVHRISSAAFSSRVAESVAGLTLHAQIVLAALISHLQAAPSITETHLFELSNRIATRTLRHSALPRQQFRDVLDALQHSGLVGVHRPSPRAKAAAAGAVVSLVADRADVMHALKRSEHARITAQVLCGTGDAEQ